MTNASRAKPLTEAVRALATEIGFDLVGVTTAEPFADRSTVAIDRVRDGLMDGLRWYTEERVNRGADPAHLLSGARSIISLALSYWGDDAPEKAETEQGRRAATHGKVARYAWGEDYHDVFARMVAEFVERLPEAAGGPVMTRWYTDTGPMQDRAVAERAGLGWFGKNSNILTTIGSWVVLAQVITDMDLAPDALLKKTCGECVLCVDACPTSAIIGPGVIDNQRCISYLTIENRGGIPVELREAVGDWVFGCDICQDVCPVNRKAELGAEYAAFSRDADERAAIDLISILEMNTDGFREAFRGSPVKRAKLWGLKRNVCVALGNIGDERAVPVLGETLREDTTAIVRGHAAWALGRIGGREAVEALELARGIERDPVALDEITLALGSPSRTESR
jgi:epoxyqueuosine reductase